MPSAYRATSPNLNGKFWKDKSPYQQLYSHTYRYSVRCIVVIKSFADKRTVALFACYAVRSIPNQIQRRARAKRFAVDAAIKIDDLRAPRGNRLEALHGDRRGQQYPHQWRICFRWSEGEAWEVEIVDYHKG
jgi:toxin HigB-1